jgi:hypothetical protein
MDAHLQKQIEDAYELVVAGNHRYLHLWQQEILFTWRWWLSISLLLLSWVVWILSRKKESSDRLLYAGFFVIIATSWMDFLGVVCGLWHYTSKLLPTLPGFVTLDFSILPVEVMLLLQLKPHLHAGIKSVLFSSFNAFVAEPMLVALDIYVLDRWHMIYSFPIYIVVYLIAHALAYKRKQFKELR